MRRWSHRPESARIPPWYARARRSPKRTGSGRLREAPQHVVQDAAVREVFELVQRIDAARAAAPVCAVPSARGDLGRHHLPRLDGGEAGDRYSSRRRRGRATASSCRPRNAAAARPCRPGWSGGCARSFRRSRPARPAGCVPLAAQSREEPVPYSLPAKTTSGMPSLLVAHRRVVDRHLLARRIVDGDAAFTCRRHHLVLDADVGEGAAHHHFVVAAPRAVGVEIGWLRRRARCRYAPAGDACLIEPAGRDVVGGDRIAEQRRACARRRCRVTGAGSCVMPSK